MNKYKIELNPTRVQSKVNTKYYLSIYFWSDYNKDWRRVGSYLNRGEWGAIKYAIKEIDNCSKIYVNNPMWLEVKEELNNFVMVWAQS